MLNADRLHFALLLLISLALRLPFLPATEFTSAQQAAPEGLVWDVKLAPNAPANSNLRVDNTCKQKHTFTIALHNLPYLRILSKPVVTVPGGRNLVKFTEHLAPLSAPAAAERPEVNP